ncbi:hypothetical protein SLEP1_g54858 [Rubroshorea leprosula]|uniref:Uncharacterized protein n=1 Tax=Rubroshorea leprosula TaxID=152421 RepID=A0AAV5MEW6_9ROSI|nr:hypothetical protein SLEP1_g54858 [Rubroshorea leprosula]
MTDHQPKMEIASPSAVMKQPIMESDSGDAWYAFSNMQKSPTVEVQEVVSDETVHPQEETQGLI